MDISKMDMRKIVVGAYGTKEASCVKEVDPVTGQMICLLKEVDKVTNTICLSEADRVT
ncbi:MAG: hypothetical protein JSV88_07500 [Candidatus Aminicenantes bacterium]|nr:MAG: hypothetical protein JSV88_07500 [Candidatus Aminicenantes bacterium]